MNLGKNLIYTLAAFALILSCKADPLRPTGGGVGYQPANLQPTEYEQSPVASTTPTLADTLPNDKKYTNADGSVTIVNPRFLFNGAEVPLVTPSLNGQNVGQTTTGICVLFGLPTLIAQSIGGTVPNGVQLTKDGKITDKTSYYTFVKVNSVTCSNGAITSTGSLTNSGKNTNSDGSVTITEPRFKYNDKEERIIEGGYAGAMIKSSSNGICRQFLLLKVVGVSYSATAATDGVELTQYGQFKGYVGNTGGYSYKYITSVTCSN